MNLRKSLIGAAILVAIGVGIGASGAEGEKAVPQILNDETFIHWRDFIHPHGDETAWERPGWQTTLWAGLTLAQEKKKPFLVWTMTGHPCGMT